MSVRTNNIMGRVLRNMGITSVEEMIPRLDPSTFSQPPHAMRKSSNFACNVPGGNLNFRKLDKKTSFGRISQFDFNTMAILESGSDVQEAAQ